MIYIVNNKFRTAKSQIYLGNVGKYSLVKWYVFTERMIGIVTINKISQVSLRLSSAILKCTISNLLTDNQTSGVTSCLDRFDLR